jgi:broad specificity phosphatase PhoE
MRRLFFITHADVQIDPDVPVPDWGLNETGRARHRALEQSLPPVGAIWSSAEQKAREGAALLAEPRGQTVQVLEALGENDRSATGYLPGPEFEAMADAFFANPTDSVRGWERAVDAQARIVKALQQVVAESPSGDIAVIAHGGVGALTRAHLLRAPIDRSHDQPPGSGGGNMLQIALPGWGLHADWLRF